MLEVCRQLGGAALPDTVDLICQLIVSSNSLEVGARGVVGQSLERPVGK